MSKLAVIGSPISQSKSPLIHNIWLEHYKLEYEYEKIEVQKEELKQFIIQDKNKFLGLNITAPHKENIIQYIDEIDIVAKKIGAVNTIKNNQGNLLATNTDYYGYLETIKSIELKDKICGVLGSGGAARAIISALVSRHPKQIIIAARNIEKASKLKELGDNISVVEWDNLPNNVDFLVNTTTLGMENMPILDINLDKFSRDLIISDIVYKPKMTNFLNIAEKKNLKILDGVTMFLAQAAKSFEFWFGIYPEIKLVNHLI